MPKISIIIPVYNVEKYIRKCIESVFEQSFLDWEAICIDDGSTDNSYNILKEFANIDNRIRIRKQKNQGLAATRNRGIKISEGDYLCFLDGDDYLHAHALEQLYKKASENQLEILSYETELYYEGAMKEKNNKDFYYYKKNRYEGIHQGRHFLKKMMDNNEYCDSACLLFIDHLWLGESDISFYEGILYEDALFCMQCLLKAEKMAHLPKRLYVYRVRENSIMTSDIYWKNVKSAVVLYREILRCLYVESKNDYELQKFMADYLSKIAWRIKFLDEYRIDNQDTIEKNNLDELFLISLEVGDYRREVNEEILLLGLEKLVEKSKEIVLYGNGWLGKAFFSFIKDRNLKDKVRCFAVSRLENKESEIEGIPILLIEDALQFDATIILSVIETDAKNSMIKKLKELHVNEYEIFDHYLYRALRHYQENIK